MPKIDIEMLEKEKKDKYEEIIKLMKIRLLYKAYG